MSTGFAAAQERTARVDSLVAEHAGKLAASARYAIVGLGAYGLQQLTPHADVEVLFLHTGELTLPEVTETVCYPIWEQAIHIEPFVRTVDESSVDVRRSWSAASRFLDARFISGERALFESLNANIQPLRRDTDRLRHRLRTETAHRHATHLPATASSTPDVFAGRGGLLDIQALRWLDLADDPSVIAARDFLLDLVSRAEELSGHTVHRLASRVVERLDAEEASLLPRLFAHARGVAFRLDGALTPDRDDRPLGPSLSVQRNQIVAQRLPPLERAPGLGLRVANLAGLASPSDDLMTWASHNGGPLMLDAPALEQLWLLLRAADWRAFDFLDVTGLIERYFPELSQLHRQPGAARTGDLAVDTHCFFALRRLHEWTETSEDPFASRAWRAARQRDPVYLAVLLHELAPSAVSSLAQRVGLPDAVVDALAFAASSYQSLLDTATRRDLYDEDLVLDLATRVGTRQRLGMLFLVAIAHELAAGTDAWSPWKADLVRQLFGSIETALRQPAEVGARRTRSLEQHRERIVRALERLNLYQLAPLVNRLPRRYVLTRSPTLAARHLALLARGPLSEGEVRIQPSRHRQPGLTDLLIVAHDRPGLLSMMAGVLALRGASVLAADAATSSDGLVLDVFTVSSHEALQWSQIEADIRQASLGAIPLEDLLGTRPVAPEEAAAIHVVIDNTASQFFSVVEVRAPDQVGLLYRIASALAAEQLDIHHARIATHPATGALDVFYVRTPSGEKLAESETSAKAEALTARLRGSPLAGC